VAPRVASGQEVGSVPSNLRRTTTSSTDRPARGIHLLCLNLGILQATLSRNHAITRVRRRGTKATLTEAYRKKFRVRCRYLTLVATLTPESDRSLNQAKSHKSTRAKCRRGVICLGETRYALPGLSNLKKHQEQLPILKHGPFLERPFALKRGKGQAVCCACKETDLRPL
jgi:hypothetical protein